MSATITPNDMLCWIAAVVLVVGALTVWLCPREPEVRGAGPRDDEDREE